MSATDDAWAMTEVVVSGQDLTVPLSLQAHVAISGRLLFDGAPPPVAAPVRYRLKPTSTLAAFVAAASGPEPVVNGAFAKKVVPGKYQLEFTGVPTGWYPLSAMTGGIDTFDAPIEVGPGTPSVEWVVTFTNRPAELAGSLVDTGGRPATEFFVIAFPQARDLWSASRRVVRTRPASDGAFSFRNLPPGDYFVAAVADLEPGETIPAELLDEAVSGATKVTIAPGQRSLLPLRIARAR
jgi:hypothetical protein